MRYHPDHKEKTRRRVLEEATKAIRRQGPYRLGVAGVMKQAGLTHGGFYAHFSSKDALVSAAIGAMFDGALERWTRATHDRPPEAGLAAYIESYLSAETPRHQGRRVSDGRARLGSAALGCPVADRVCGRRAGAHRYHRSAARAARPREAGGDGGVGGRGGVRGPLPRPGRARSPAGRCGPRGRAPRAAAAVRASEGFPR